MRKVVVSRQALKADAVIRVIYSPTEAPTKVGYDEIKDQVPSGT
jgi:hypothetical protein